MLSSWDDSHSGPVFPQVYPLFLTVERQEYA